MVYTQKQIQIIQKKRPDLKFQRIPTLDDLILDFLKKYDVIVQSPRDLLNSNYKNASLFKIKISKTEIDTTENLENKIEEWQKWKKWTLENSDFEKFRVNKLRENQIFNKQILDKLNSDEIKEEFKSFFEKSNRIKINKLLFNGLIILFIIFSLRLIIFVLSRNQSISLFYNLVSVENLLISEKDL